ncbi:hypothetical protein [Marinobacter xestospongiae]|uniref:hypothetical protein n=1 Tax=Marinobacter xestospongiae TaxID=994319 RepID=UPI00200464D4|nr:hypothetical protein [Marinobacter xestospongiae]MCK7565336.1 hypothetical protein [Marinobacter xestospongiae]
MSAIYDSLEFETPLLAKWAAFFDLAGWKWDKAPAAIGNWKPDFRVTFICNHSECGGSHTILVSVLDVDRIESVKGHPAMTQGFSTPGENGSFVADAGALFGSSPNVTYWEMAHGAGGGQEEVSRWVADAAQLWDQAKGLIARENG